MGDAGGLRGMSTRAIVDQMVLSFSEGKGGGFFFWSIDRRFMVKTLEATEFRKLRDLLPSYFHHMLTRGSLLPRFYGAYSITIQNHEKRFVVMESVFREAPKGKVHQRYVSSSSTSSSSSSSTAAAATPHSSPPSVPAAHFQVRSKGLLD